ENGVVTERAGFHRHTRRIPIFRLPIGDVIKRSGTRRNPIHVRSARDGVSPDYHVSTLKCDLNRDLASIVEAYAIEIDVKHFGAEQCVTGGNDLVLDGIRAGKQPVLALPAAILEVRRENYRSAV